jgi:plastocyanin
MAAIGVIAAMAGRAAADRGAVRGMVAVVRGGVAQEERSGVLVYVVGFDEPPPPEEARVEQVGKRFIPSLVAVTAGQRIAFPNGDPFYHNVFSPSAIRKFDLGQYRPGESRSRVFPTTGVADVYCNIHPQMSATIVVLPNRRYAMTDRSGSFVIEGIPAGRWRLYAYSRRAERPVGQDVEVRAGGTSEVSIRLVETRPDFAHLNKYGESYRDSARYR